MTDAIDNIHNVLDEFALTADGYAVVLALDLAEIVIQGMRDRDWSETELAEVADIPVGLVSRIVHSNADVKLSVVGKLLHALGVRPRLEPAP